MSKSAKKDLLGALFSTSDAIELHPTRAAG